MLGAATAVALVWVPMGPLGSAVGALPRPQAGAAIEQPVQLTARQVTMVQRVAPQVTLESIDDERISEKGTDLAAISAIESYDVPAAAMRAYRNAAEELATTVPGCQITWTMLAGIGRVESDHGRYGGSVLRKDGLPQPAIRGIALDGNGVAAIPDSDGGEWDGDSLWDRAVGPMQFIPTTWTSAGRDGDDDGEKNPNDIDDAALAAAYYLCPSSGSLLDDATLSAAIFSYNHSEYYVALVKAFKVGYETGVFDIPSPPPPPEEPEKKKGKKKKKDKDETHAKDGKAEKSAKGDATKAPSKQPSKTPTKTPSKPSGGGTKSGSGSGSGGSGSGGGGTKPGGGTSSPTSTPTTTPTTTPTESAGTTSTTSTAAGASTP